MPENNPLVSVLIPCYNVSGYIDKAVRSILAQTYTNMEIWLVDDGSTDDILQKINAFKDKRIKILALAENTKKIGAVNEVFRKVTGEYITFQDADDWSEPNRIQEQVEQFAMNADLGICFTNFRYINDTVYAPARVALTNEELRTGFLDFGKQKNMPFELPMCPTMMVSKAALQTVGSYPIYFMGRMGEDIYMAYRILKEYEGITTNNILYNYTKRKGSITDDYSTGKNVKYAYSFELLSKIIHKDMYEGINVFDSRNEVNMDRLEFEACEEALVGKIKLLNKMTALYRNSMSYRLGWFLLTPWRVLKKLKG